MGRAYLSLFFGMTESALPIGILIPASPTLRYMAASLLLPLLVNSVKSEQILGPRVSNRREA
jgi:hypothetical protein